MQPQEEPPSARCRSSSDTPTSSFESKGVDFRRFRHVDPRYSVYRWDCGSYPYFKAPVPTSSPCSGVQPVFTPNNVGYPGHVSTAPDIFCDGRRDCYGGVVVGSGSGQDFIPQPQRCICPDTHDPRYHPQLLGPPDAVNLEPRPVGCLCCGQHVVNPRGPINHPRHVDSVRLFPPPVYRTTVGPDVVHVYPSTRELIDAPVQCLPSSETLSIGSAGILDQPPERRAGYAGPLMEGTTCGGGGGQTSSSPAAPGTKESVSAENRDVRRSNGRRPERETDASFESCCSVKTDEEIRADTMTNVGTVTTELPKRSELPTGKISDAKMTPTRSTSKVTPLYGLPSWWGDEPEPDFDQQRKYNQPTVTSSSSFDSPNLKKQTEHSDRVPIATTRTSLSNSNPPHATTKGCSLGPTGVPIATDYSLPPITGRLDVQGHKHCQSNNDLVNNCPTIFENPGLHNSRSPPRIRNSESAGSLGTFETSTFRSVEENFSSPNVSQSLKVYGHHSPPERDRPSKVDGELRHLQHFVYPDPLLPLPVERDFRLVAYSDDCGPLKCKAPTAFIVDLQEINGDDNSQCRITVKTSLRQFLPPRCERSLQRRLSWMKQNRKPHSATERSEGRTEDENRGEMVAADPRQRFRLSQSSSFKDSFEEAVANDAIADDVSEAGTYTIDVSSDGESVAVADARERILATFGITGIEDEDLEKAEWPESGKGYFEKDWDKDCSKKEESLKSKTNRRPTTLSDNSNISDSRSNSGADPVTPTAESYTWSFSEVFTPPLLSKKDLPAQDDIMLTIYTETAAGCSITSSDTQPEYHEKNLHQEVKDPSRRLRILDRAVLVADTEWSSKTCESWPTESTMDTGHPLLDQKTVASSSHTSTKPSYSGAEACLPLEGNKAGGFLSSTSTAASESGRIILPTDRDYFKIPASSYSGPVSSLKIGVRAGGITDTEILDPRVTLRRKSTPASESGDSLESPGNITTASESLMFADQTSRTGASSNKKSLMCDPEKDRDGTVRTECNELPTKAVGHHSCGNSMDGKSDSDEDGSSVDPRDGLFTARTVASRTTEVTPKPKEEFVEVLVSQKARTTRKSVEESRRASHQSTVTESESPATRGEISAKKPLTSSCGPKTQITSPMTDKPVASRHPKTKPPTPKSFPKSPSFPDGQLSSRRCFSDLDVADHDETSSETASPLVSEGKGTGGKGTTNSSVEHTRMNRTFALRCARREASDGTDAHRSDNQQRSTRTAKKSSSSKFDDVQRSRSASRSRPGGASPRSLFESSRSADNSVNVGQRVVRKSQENDKKTRQTSTTDSNTFSRSLTRDDESSSHKSAAAFRPPNATRTAKKKNLASDRGKEDVVDGASGVTVKGSPVQSRPLSSSLPVQEPAANEWTRRKKYNPRQSLQTEVSLKKTGKPDGKPIAGNVDKTESRPRNRKKVADSSGKNAPSTPSDWTDDEKLQLTPRGRDLPAVCQLSAKVKLLSDQVLQSLRKRPEFKVNEMILQSPKQASSDTDSLENTSPEFLYIFHNLEAAERQMSAVFKVLSTHN